MNFLELNPGNHWINLRLIQQVTVDLPEIERGSGPSAKIVWSDASVETFTGIEARTLRAWTKTLPDQIGTTIEDEGDAMQIVDPLPHSIVRCRVFSSERPRH